MFKESPTSPYSTVFNNKQECIPVGCVPAARWPYLGGVPGLEGVYLVLRGAVPGLGWVYLVPGGVPGPGGCTWSWGGVPGLGCGPGLGGHTWSRGVPGLGGYLVLGGVSALGGFQPGGRLLVGGIPACTEADTPPPLLTESQTPVKTLPWPNFVAAGNYSALLFKVFLVT